MSGVQHNVLEIKFRLSDGTDLGPKTFSDTASAATLKESVLALWPKDKPNGPKYVKDIKLISCGRIMENNKTVKSYRGQLYDLPDGFMTMHVVIQRPAGEGRKMSHLLNHHKCVCTIM